MAGKIIGINLNGIDYDYEDEETSNQAEENTSKIGDLADLETTAKTDLVSAINEVNGGSSAVGNLADLTTTVKTNVVSAINEVNGKAEDNADAIGDLASLTTTAKASAVSAINEVNGKAEDNADAIGDLSNLETTAKTDLVSAINELAGTEPSYTVVYWFNNALHSESIENPRAFDVGAYTGTTFESVAKAQALYKEVLKTLWQKKNGKPYTFYSSNINGNYGGSVNFCLSGSVGMSQKGTYTDDEDNPSQASGLVTQSISLMYGSRVLSLRIVELPADGGTPIYISAYYDSQGDTIVISAENTTTPPYITIVVEN